MTPTTPATTGEPPRESAVATLVVADAVDKPTALASIARAVGAAVDRRRPARPRVPLGDDAWVEIDIPKFGEPPPLAIDVHAVGDPARAQRYALALMQALRESTTWAVATDFERLRSRPNDLP